MESPYSDLSASQIVAIIGAIAAAEIAALRRDDEQYWQQYRWQYDTVLATQKSSHHSESDQIVVDSLEWMSVAARVAQFFQLDKAGVDDYLLRKKRLGDWAEVVVASRELGYRDITFLTSGSTGSPEAHSHQWHSLVAEAQEHALRLKQQSRPVERLVSVVPPHHIYGFIFSVLLVNQLNCSLLSGFTAFRAAHTRQLKSGDLLIGFPGWYQQLCQQQQSFPGNVNAISSAGSLQRETAQQLLALGIERVTEIYGSTETAGLANRSYFLEAYQLNDRWQPFSATSVVDKLSGDVVELPDKVEWFSDRHFKPLGRHDQATKINGHKIYPQRIAELIEQHPTVAQARVRVATDSNSSFVKALIIPVSDYDTQNPQPLLAALNDWLSTQLTAHQLPKHFAVSEAIPCNSMGKEVDWSIASQQSNREKSLND